MKNLFTGSSKLIVIYILTVLVSGSILTYLGIINISNFEELTEKKITEEERALAELFTVEFQNDLERLATELKNNTNIEPILPGTRFSNTDEIKDQLIMDTNGVFVKPHYIQNTFHISQETRPDNFKENIRSAEHYEFVLKNFTTAENIYLRSLINAGTPSDSAKVYNAVARLCFKKDDKKGAFNYDKRILTDFKSSLSDYGFPYAYFSVDQLLKLSNSQNHTEIIDLMISFLTDLENGIIPLNESTSDILKKIADRADELKKNEKITEINRLINSISDQLSNIENYGESIKNMIDKEKSGPADRIGEILVIKPKNEVEELMLLRKDSSYLFGNIITLKELYSSVIKNPSFDKTNFEYGLKIVKKENNHSINNELATVAEFSPYFDKNLIHVSLKDKHIVEDFVFRRKLTAGIGIFLLLAAMILGLLLLIRDVNRNERMERLRADFVSNVTHELKTPLTAINMFADSILLERVKNKEGLKKYAHIIVKESEKLKRMINNILDFSRKENDKLTYDLKESDLLDIVNSTMEEMNYWLEINNFNVALKLQENIKAVVDPEGIKQVLSNLISNAIKYSHTKKELIVRLFKEGKKAFIEIEDFGIGIPEEKLDKIFEKFYRVNSNENETVSGTGLGLTVSKDIIEAQNGELLVESTLNKGSKFTIVLNI